MCGPGDVYVIRWYEDHGRKTRYLNVGTDLNEASRLRMQKEMTLSQPDAAKVPEKAALGISTAIEEYLASVAGTKSEKTATGYRFSFRPSSQHYSH
jgi:hypothetical protein